MRRDDQEPEEATLHEHRWRPRPKTVVMRRLRQGLLASVLILAGVAGTLLWSQWRTLSQPMPSKGMAKEAQSPGGDPGTSAGGRIHAPDGWNAGDEQGRDGTAGQ